MNISREDLKLNYRTHPYFQFSQPAFEIESNFVEEFNHSYKLATSFHPMIATPEETYLENDCKMKLTSVFTSMLEQGKDSYEKIFLEELQDQSLRLLLEEIRSYRLRRYRNKIKFQNSDQRNKAIALKDEKYFFGNLSASTLKELSEMGRNDLLELQNNAAKGLLTRDALSRNSGATVRDMANLLAFEYDSTGVTDAVSSYMGRKMMVGGLAYELSVPKAKWWASTFADLPRAPETLYAHLDESINVPKAIVYLTDVDKELGPTSCYPGLYCQLGLSPLQEIIGRIIGMVGSNENSALHGYYSKTYHQSVGSENFRRHFMRLPESIRFNSHFGWDVLPLSSLEQEMMKKEIFMTGEAGRFIVFDGAKLLHRGGLIQRGERVALQVVFSEFSLRSKISATVRRVF